MRPQNIGIKAIQVHFPQSYILQSDLEERDVEILGEESRSKIIGKYTKGLGQSALAFCCDREDTISLAMSAITSLFEKYNLSPNDFGRLEIGSESGIDRSKSIKSFLMSLFPDNKSLMGVDNVNACYGGTAALLNSLAWVESSQWDGRLALVVAVDIAVYEQMAARPTGGCGAVAIAIGPDAPLVIETNMISHYFTHGYDFYKPNPSNPHPLVDGPLSLVLYFECLDSCFIDLRKRHPGLTVDDFDFVCFHTPFINQVKKSTGRLLFLKEHPDNQDPSIESSRKDPVIVSQWSQQASTLFQSKVSPSCKVSQFCGNGYTSSLYLAISSLIDSQNLDGKRVLCFSYGSGAASSMFSFRVNGDLSQIKSSLNIQHRLDSRIKRTVAEYESAVSRELIRFASAPYLPQDSTDLITEGSWYLEEIDSNWRRSYKKK